MLPQYHDWIRAGLAAMTAFLVAFLMTPPVKRFAEHVGAIDVPKDGRRVHDHPIPRMGGLAIFMGFVLSVLLFVNMSTPVMGMLLGAVIIAVMGAVDDIISLKPLVKLAGQIVAAVVAIRCGIVFDTISNPNVFSQDAFIQVGWLSVPLTLLWIVGCTNAVNLIDGLDGLAVGVSAISSLTMFVASLYVADPFVSILLAALVGACLGFMPYNLNPAKIFAGDTGALLLGYVLSTMSVIGMFKTYAIISFLLPFLVLALPLFDTIFAILRRICHGQNPMQADRGHVHHRLIDMGLSQKQAVAILYCISTVFGLAAVVLATNGRVKALVVALAFMFIISIAAFVYSGSHRHHDPGGEAPKDAPGEAPKDGGKDKAP